MPPRRRNETDETGATPPATVEPQRYSDGTEGWAAGNVAPETMYLDADSEPDENGLRKPTSSQVERGWVLINKGQTVTPDVARYFEQQQTTE